MHRLVQLMFAGVAALIAASVLGGQTQGSIASVCGLVPEHESVILCAEQAQQQCALPGNPDVAWCHHRGLILEGGGYCMQHEH
jgi:hypothetical protein